MRSKDATLRGTILTLLALSAVCSAAPTLLRDDSTNASARELASINGCSPPTWNYPLTCGSVVKFVLHSCGSSTSYLDSSANIYGQLRNPGANIVELE